MAQIEARQTVAADSTPAAISSNLGPQEDYELVLFNTAAKGGNTVYIAASASDAAINGLSVRPSRVVRSGPYQSLPYLYAASSTNVSVQIIGYPQETTLEFNHTDITDE
jgi:hypothetical protein